MSLFFQGSNAANNDLILNTASQLLEPFKQSYAKAVNEALAAIRSGQPMEQAGRILMNAVQADVSQTAQVAREKLKSLQDTNNNLADLLSEQERKIFKLGKELEHLQREYDLVVNEAKGYRETISSQNRTLERQHRNLQKLLGNTQEDEEE